MARRAKQLGFYAVALELDDFDNQQRWPVFQEVLRAEGLLPGVWWTMAENIVRTPDDAGFAIAEVEGWGDFVGGTQAILSGNLPDCPLATVTNFAGFAVTDQNGVMDIAASRANAKPWVDAGFVCHAECYVNENPLATPERMEFTAVNQLGFKEFYPVFGTYGNNHTLADYQQWFDYSGYSAYLIETITT